MTASRILSTLNATYSSQYWVRREARLSYKWGTFAPVTSYRDQRPNYVGEMRVSKVTGKMEKHYPCHKRRLMIAISAIFTVVLLAGACVVMVISMNVQGYISREDQEEFEGDHPLYFPRFARLAEKDAIFDCNSVWKSFLPVLLRSLMVTMMNKQYRVIAEYLTEWENHETSFDHNNSVVLKRVLFEAFDAYIILFYLTIYERNIYLLRLELVGAFSVDTFRRLVTECALPYIMQTLSKKDEQKSMSASKKNDDLKQVSGSSLSSEADLEEYEQFDDLIEMLIQFGYVTLFASAFPLAAFVAVGANYVESRTDLWKLTRLCRRPSPNRIESLGMWNTILRVMEWMSALTNCLIFAFASSQMRQWLPENYTTNEWGKSTLVDSTADETLLIMFAIEHALVLVGLVLLHFVPPVPGFILAEVEKRQWLHDISAQKARLRMMKVSSIRNLGPHEETATKLEAKEQGDGSSFLSVLKSVTG